MLIHNLRSDFYDVVKKEHTLLIVSADVDALCASAILTYAFSCDDVTCSLTAVDSWSGIGRAVQEHKEQVKNLVLINCGAMRSQHELELPEGVRIFILDSHRPVHLDNIYLGGNQVCVIVHPREVADWQLPEPSELYPTEAERNNEENEGSAGEYEDDEDDALSESDSDDQSTRGEQRGGRRRQGRTLWWRERKQAKWEYYMHSWHSPSSSVFMLELLHELGKSNTEMMWCAAVGLSSQFTDHLISVENYSDICLDRMRVFIRKFSPFGAPNVKKGDDVLRISFEKELTLPLYCHWSLYHCISNDINFICKSKLWTQKGESNLKHNLAKLGLTLSECRQQYAVMTTERRLEVFETLYNHMNSGFGSFVSHFGYSARYNAADFARILAVRLECTSPGARDDGLYGRFTAANQLLKQFLKIGGRATPQLEQAIDAYKTVLKAIVEMSFFSLSQGHIISNGRYFLLSVHKSPGIHYLTSSRHCLFLYAHYLLRAFADSIRRTKKPLIISVPFDEEDSGWHLLLGLMPLAEIISDTKQKSIIGRMFKQVAKDLRLDVIMESFDSCIVRVRASDRARFYHGLESRLEQV